MVDRTLKDIRIRQGRCPTCGMPRRELARVRRRIDRINEWCSDLLDAVAIEYFPILIVGFVVLALVVVAMISLVRMVG